MGCIESTIASKEESFESAFSQRKYESPTFDHSDDSRVKSGTEGSLTPSSHGLEDIQIQEEQCEAIAREELKLHNLQIFLQLYEESMKKFPNVIDEENPLDGKGREGLHWWLYAQRNVFQDDSHVKTIKSRLCREFEEMVYQTDDSESFFQRDAHGYMFIDWILCISDESLSLHLFSIVLKRLTALSCDGFTEGRIASLLLSSASVGRLSLIVPALSDHLLMHHGVPLTTFLIPIPVFSLDWWKLDGSVKEVLKLQNGILPPLHALFIMSKWCKTCDCRFAAVSVSDVQHYAVQLSRKHLLEVRGTNMELYCSTLCHFLSFPDLSDCLLFSMLEPNALRDISEWFTKMSMECVLSLLQVQCTIDYTVSNLTESISYAVHTTLNPQEGARLLQALLHHVSLYGDTLDWGCVFVDRRNENHFTDFASSLADSGRLSILWPLLKNVRYFSTLRRNKKISISYASVIPWDWCEIEEQERRRFILHKGVKPLKIALEEFFSFKRPCRDSASFGENGRRLANDILNVILPSLQKRHRDVAESDIKDGVMRLIFQALLKHCNFEEVKAFILTLLERMDATPIDFSECSYVCENQLFKRLDRDHQVKLKCKQSLLFIIAHSSLELLKMNLEEEARNIICSFVKRIEKHPEDIMDSNIHFHDEQVLKRVSIFTFFASHQLLSFFVNCVSTVSTDAQRIFCDLPIKIETPVSRMDWDSFSILSFQQYFHLTAGFVPINEELLTLSRMIKGNSYFPISRLEAHMEYLLSRGASLNYMKESKNESAFVNFFLFYCTEGEPGTCSVNGHELMETMILYVLDRMVEGEIDFTVTDTNGNTPLHLLCKWPNTDSACRVLQAVIQGINRVCDSSRWKVNWSQKNHNNYDFLQLALLQGKLSCFLPIIRQQPFFASHSLSSLLALFNTNSLEKGKQPEDSSVA